MNASNPRMDQLVVRLQELLALNRTAHPVDGVSPGDRCPEVVTCFVEMLRNSPVKLEVRKRFGILGVDRPAIFSSLTPLEYGFIPQTYCGARVGKLCAERTGRKKILGDGDPLDICVLSGHDLPAPGLLLNVRPIGGLRMVDRGEADDKIIAVLEQDLTFENIREIGDMSEGLLTKLKDYFLKYKKPPEKRASRAVYIHEVYGREEAYHVIAESRADYVEKFGDPANRTTELKNLLSELIGTGA